AIELQRVGRLCAWRIERTDPIWEGRPALRAQAEVRDATEGTALNLRALPKWAMLAWPDARWVRRRHRTLEVCSECVAYLALECWLFSARSRWPRCWPCQARLSRRAVAR